MRKCAVTVAPCEIYNLIHITVIYFMYKNCLVFFCSTPLRNGKVISTSSYSTLPLSCAARLIRFYWGIHQRTHAWWVVGRSVGQGSGKHICRGFGFKSWPCMNPKRHLIICWCTNLTKHLKPPAQSFSWLVILTGVL